MGFQTDCTTTGEDRRRFHGSIPPPIYESSLFTFPTYAEFERAFPRSMEGDSERPVYGRGSNPTVAVLERKVALLEGAQAARALASGMAAIGAAVLSTAGAGDHVVATESIYSTAHRLLSSYLPRLGIETTFVDCSDIQAVEEAIRPETRVLYLESPGNPGMHLVDIPAMVRLAQAHGLTTILDNSMATPYNQKPIQYGVDLVVHSASKYLSGHSDVIAGIVAGSTDRMRALSAREIHDLGGIIGPFEAWLLLRGLRTLGLRMRAHNDAGLSIARWLQTRPEVEAVHYPGLLSHPQHQLAQCQMSGYSGMLSIVMHGGLTSAIRLADQLTLFGIGVSWGGFESLALPYRPNPEVSESLASRLGLVPGLVRLSIGLEDPDDLVADLEQALARTMSG